MRRKDWGLVIAVLLTAGLFGIWGRFQSPKEPTAVRITVDGRSSEYPLGEDREVTIAQDGKYNSVRIEGKTAYMESAGCPDQTCVHQGKLKDGNGQIVCLPNRVVVELVGGEASVDSVVY